MRAKRWQAAAAALVVIGAAAYFALPTIILYVPGLLLPHIYENRPVTWSPGPDHAESPPAARKPNIVVIVADDLGWNDLSFNGGGVAGGSVPTDNINAIAKEGVTFTNGYAGNATCAPSRAAIMTGRYPTRFGFEFTPVPMSFSKLIGNFRSNTLRHPLYFADREPDWIPREEQGLPVSEVTIAKLLQRDGYHTMHIGKWHLGESPHFQPQRVGFDESLGFLWGASKYLRASDPNVENSIQQFDPIDKWLWPNLPFAVLYNGSTWFEPSEYMTDYLGKQAVAAIDANANRPFFMYLAFNAPHTPLQALKSDYDALPQITDHRLRVYAAMIRALDRNVGRVMDELKAKGLDQNTLVFFTSDNGGANYIGLPEINKPFRGWKATFFEGGVHTPFFIRWPATIQAGTTYDKPISHFDIFATAAGAANAPLPTDRIIDGVNLIPYVTGQNTSNPHDFLFWRSGDYKTVLDHGYKLQVSARPNRIWLFNLTNDPNEHHDLSAEMPDKVTEIRAKLDAFNQTQSPPLWASLLEAPIAIDHPLGFPDSPKDDYIYWAN